MKELTKEEIIIIIKGYEHDRYFGAFQNFLPEHEYNYVANDIVKLLNQNTKPLIDEISELKSQVSNCNRMIGHLEEISINKQAEIAKLKASKSEANEAVEFLEWTLSSGYCLNPHCKDSRWRTLEQIHSSKPMMSNGITTQELYEIFKTKNNK